MIIVQINFGTQKPIMCKIKFKKIADGAAQRI